jgi:hypothetical protein
MLRSPPAASLVAALTLTMVLAHCGSAPPTVTAPTTTATPPPVTPAPPVHPVVPAVPTAAPLDPQLEVVTLTPGAGPEAKPGDMLVVNYVGTFSDGTEFDSSTRPGRQPFRFVLGQGRVIKGWDQGLVGMQVGGTRRLVIPPALAYGSKGRPGVPAGSTLIFEIELIAINPP